MTSITDALREATQILQNEGVPEARREAGSLMSFAIEKDRTFLFSHGDETLGDEELQSFQSVVERRASGEPLQYITGTQDFFGREFLVTPAVLIPRPETELLVEAALQVIDRLEHPPVVCDVGTGSGCIALTVLCERPESKACGLDISSAALEVARANASRLSVSERIEFLLSDCFEALDPNSQKFDLVLSNPPYVSAGVINGLQREVRDHEPHVALSPGPDGLAIIRRLFKDSSRFLNPAGYLIMEIGFDQGESVQELVDKDVWDLIDIKPDLQGIPRIVVLQMSNML